jgi:PAS domain-containing protein
MVGDDDSGAVPGPRDRGSETAGDAGTGYSELLARVPAIVYVADPGEDGRWHYASPQIEQILGYTPEEWCADPDLWADRLHPDDREWVLARVAGLAVDEGMRGRAIERLLVENDLRRALERGELRLEYQPVVSLHDFAIVGVEALLRWRHPERGEISPAEFIRALEHGPHWLAASGA